jgi:soluble lytic murein transglycosylase-like protein
MNDSTSASISLISKAEGVSTDLVMAIIMTESAGNTFAVRYEPGWKYFVEPNNWALKLRITYDTERILQACSWGLMQIMGSVAREMLFDGELPKLCQEDVGLTFGVRKLKTLVKKYPKTNDVIAAYNAGTPRIKPDGKYANQVYVDKVNAYLNMLRASK